MSITAEDCGSPREGTRGVKDDTHASTVNPSEDTMAPVLLRGEVVFEEVQLEEGSVVEFEVELEGGMQLELSGVGLGVKREEDVMFAVA